MAPVSAIAAPSTRAPPLQELPPHAVPAHLVAVALGTDGSRGLTEAEATDRLATFGANVTARPRRPPYARIAVRQLADPLVALLVAAAVVSAGNRRAPRGRRHRRDRGAQRRPGVRSGGRRGASAARVESDSRALGERHPRRTGENRAGGGARSGRPCRRPRRRPRARGRAYRRRRASGGRRVAADR